MISLVSMKGPSVTITFPPFTRVRTPWELGASPPVPTSTPAFIISPARFPIAVMSFGSGRTPASKSLSAFAISMNFIVVLLLEPGCLQTPDPWLNVTSNEEPQEGHRKRLFFEKNAIAYGDKTRKRRGAIRRYGEM